MAKLLKVDDSNRSDHWYLTPGDRCYYFYEYTAHKGFGHSKVNSFIANLKKPTELPVGFRLPSSRAYAALSR